VRNTLLIILISFPIAFALLGIGFVVIDRWGHDAFIRWDGLAGFTIVLFGFFIGDSEKVLRQWRFWALFAILLVVHLTAFVIVLSRVEEWRLTWFMVIVVEYLPFRFLRDRFVDPLLR
jgi:hypothetical protein